MYSAPFYYCCDINIFAKRSITESYVLPKICPRTKLYPTGQNFLKTFVLWDKYFCPRIRVFSSHLFLTSLVCLGLVVQNTIGYIGNDHVNIYASMLAGLLATTCNISFTISHLCCHDLATSIIIQIIHHSQMFYFKNVVLSN